jgi:hypothetical protein
MLRSLVLITLLCGACANPVMTPLISSNKSEVLTQRYSKIFVVGQSSTLPQRMGNRMHVVQNNLVQKLQKAGVEVINEPYVYLSLLSPAQLEAKINAAAPQAVLTFSLDFDNGHNFPFIYNLTLEDRMQNMPVWRCRTGSGGLDGGPSVFGPAIADRILNKMKADGIILGAELSK